MSVLHLDSGRVYGSHHQVLTFAELEAFIAGTHNMSQKYSNKVQQPAQPVQAEQDVAVSNELLEFCRSNSRKFNLELTPKLLYSRGDIIELVISSGAGANLEFKLLDESYVMIDDAIELVPGSRQEIFANTDLSLLEKRKLMKLLTSTLTFDQEDPSSYQGTIF